MAKQCRPIQGDDNNNLDALPKTVDIVGAGGDSLTINDQPNATNALITQSTPTFTITSQSVTRSNAVTHAGRHRHPPGTERAGDQWPDCDHRRNGTKHF
jgi:hypothetical protein